MITENLSTLKIHKLTQAQYDRELAAGNIDPNALYLTPEEEKDIDLTGYATQDYVDTRFVRATITLAADGWEENCQTIAITSVTADPSLTDVTASPETSDENYTAYTESGVRLYSQNEGSITFKCEDVPSVDLIVNVVVNRVLQAASSEDGGNTSIITNQLPTVTADNNGDFLRVVDGKWAAATIPIAEEASF